MLTLSMHLFAVSSVFEALLFTTGDNFYYHVETFQYYYSLRKLSLNSLWLDDRKHYPLFN